MILRASSRGGPKQLAQHLLSDENDHVSVHAVEGFMTDDVEAAFQEMYAISRGTKCTKFMFSLSLNPPPHEEVSIEDFEQAIEKVEERLKLKDQPKVVIFHEKGGNGRSRHCHCVWSRIDTNEMKAIEMNFFKRELNEIAKNLYIDHGWDLPKGFLAQGQADPRNFTLQEWQQAKRNKLDPKQIKATLQRCWKTSDDKNSFKAALTDSGYFLARGDKRGFVVLDWNGEVYSLTRALGGVKDKTLKQRLGEPSQYSTVKATQGIIVKAQSQAHTKLQKELALRHTYESKPIQQRKAELLRLQRKARNEQKDFHQERQNQELKKRQAEYRKGIKGLFDFVTGKRRQLKDRHKQQIAISEQRDKQEREKLIKDQIQERKAIEAQLDIVKQRQQKEVMSLNADFVKRLKGKELSEDLKHSFNPDKAIRAELGVQNDISL